MKILIILWLLSELLYYSAAAPKKTPGPSKTGPSKDACSANPNKGPPGNIATCSAPKKECFANKKPYFYFGTKSYYSAVANNKAIPKVAGCDAVQIWMVSREGVSWPFDPVFKKLQILNKLRDDIVKNHNKKCGEICAADVELLKKTQFPPTGAQAGKIMGQGEKDFQNFAKMLRTAFPTALKKPYSIADYYIRYAGLPTSEQSAKSFTNALFGPKFEFNKVQRPAEHDKMLNGPNICDSWRTKNFPKCWWKQYTGIAAKHKTIAAEVSKRLGFNYILDFESVSIMYLACSLQKALDPKKPASWCTVFTLEHLQLLRYMEDDFFYKACGPGEDKRTPLNTVMTCELYSDLITQFSRGPNNRKYLSGVFYFTDEKTLLLLLNGLGFIEQFKMSDIATPEKRSYRTSNLAPFGGNLVAALYKCSSGDPFRVGFYLNGHPLKLPQQKGDLESWEGFKNRIQKTYLNNMLCKANHCPKYITSGVEDTSLKVFYDF